MGKNTAKIKQGIRALAHKPHEVISGTVVAGSIDESALTMSVQPSDDSAPIEGVMLSVITGRPDGLVLYPEEGSNVVIASVDGPGAWMLVRAGAITKVAARIGSVSFEADAAQVSVNNGSTAFAISSSAFRMAAPAESLYHLLKDLVTSITMLTVGTPSGPSTVPVNASDFSVLLSRIDNLLVA